MKATPGTSLTPPLFPSISVDSNTFSGVKKFFGAGDEDKEFVDPFAVVKFAGKEV